MTSSTRESILTVLYIIFGLAASALAGHLVVGKAVFKHSSILLRFLMVGFSGSLIYAAARLKGPGYAILMIGLMFLGQVALNPPLRAATALNAAIWAGPVGIAFLAASYSFKSMRKIPFGKFILMGILVGIGYGLAAALFLLKSGQPLIIQVILRQVVAGLKLGGLMGFGMEIVDLIGTRLRAQTTIVHEPGI